MRGVRASMWKGWIEERVSSVVEMKYMDARDTDI